MTSHLSTRATMAYRQAAATVAPPTAVVLLFDRAIIALQRAVAEGEAKRLDESFTHASVAVTVLRGLSHALDFTRGGEVAEALRSAYTRNILSILESFGKSDMPARYRKLVTGLSDLRDAFAVNAKLPTRAEEAARRADGPQVFNRDQRRS